MELDECSSTPLCNGKAIYEAGPGQVCNVHTDKLQKNQAQLHMISLLYHLSLSNDIYDLCEHTQLTTKQGYF